MWRITALTTMSSLRVAIVGLLGLTSLFVISCMAFGYLHSGARSNIGIVIEANSNRHFQLDPRVISGGRYTLVSVTKAGAAAGFEPGEVIDMKGWTLAQRLAFTYPSLPHPPLVSVRHGFHALPIPTAESAPLSDSYRSRMTDIVIRFLLLGSGLLIIQFTRGRAALFAGLYLTTASMADSPLTTFAGLPHWVQIIALIISNIMRPAAYIARVAFSIMLLPTLAGHFKRAIGAIFAALLLVLVVLDAGRVAGILAGTSEIPISPFVLPIVQCAIQIFSLVILAIAALTASRHNRFVLRIIFFATFFTLSSYIIQEAFLLASRAPPSWMFWYFNSALLGVGIGYPWAIFARRIAGVDLAISRGVAYAFSVGLVVIVINLAETLAEQMADGRIAGLFLAYGVPIALGLSFNWVQGRITQLIEILLDGDFRNASRTIKALKADFPNAPNLAALSDQVSQGLAPVLHMQCATIYCERAGTYRIVNGRLPPTADGNEPPPVLSGEAPELRRMLQTLDPVELDATFEILRTGLLFPLIVFGRLVGALHCGARPHGRGYDRAERTMLEEFSRELAIAIVCLDPLQEIVRVRHSQVVKAAAPVNPNDDFLMNNLDKI